MYSQATHKGREDRLTAETFGEHRAKLLRDHARPTFVISFMMPVLQMALHRAKVDSWDAMALEPYALLLAIPLIAIAATYVSNSAHFVNYLVVVFDAAFTLAILNFAFHTGGALSAITIAICLKMLATAILIPWPIKYQVVSVVVTIGSYGFAVAMSTYPSLITHQIISPVISGILAIYGSIRLNGTQQSLYFQARSLENSERNLRKALAKERIVLGVVTEAVGLDRLNTALARLNRATADATSSDFSATFLIHEEEDSVELASIHRNAGQITRAIGTIFPRWSAGRLAKAMSSGKTIAISNPQDQDILPKQLLMANGIEVIAFSPILNQGKLLGVLLAGRNPGGPSFLAEETAVLSGIAAHSGITISNARLFNDLSVSETAHRDLFERANDLIFVVDAEGRVHFANKAALDFFSLDSPHKAHWPDFLVGGEFLRISRRVKVAMRRNPDDVEPFEVEVQNENQTATLEIRTCRISPPGTSPARYQCIARDITERKNREEETQALLHRLREANRLQEEFVANMSHELRTPLNVIIGYTDIISDTLSLPLDSAARSYLDRIAAASRALHRMVESILEYARLDRGRLKIIPTTFSSEHLLLEIQGLCNDVRSSSDNVELNIAQEEPIEFLTDYDRLFSLLSNLMLNGLKFTPKGRVSLHLSRFDDQAVFEISDTGIGIEPAELRNVFEAFNQADGSDTRSFGGVGLGLAIVRRNVDLLQGTIEVDSAPGEGTRFVVRIPMTLDEAASTAA